MPIPAQEKLRILQEVGLDANKYWLDDAGNIVDAPSESTVGAGIKSALYNAPRTVTGFGGAALGAAGAGALGLPSGPGAIATGVVGATAGGAAGSALGELIQSSLYPESWRLGQEMREVRNPGATKVADLASQAVLMRPSWRMTKAAASAPLDFIRSAGQISPNNAAALGNMAIGGALGGGMALGQGGSTADVLEALAAGTLLSQPTKLGQKLSRDVFMPWKPQPTWNQATAGMQEAFNTRVGRANKANQEAAAAENARRKEEFEAAVARGEAPMPIDPVQAREYQPTPIEAELGVSPTELWWDKWRQVVEGQMAADFNVRDAVTDAAGTPVAGRMTPRANARSRGAIDVSADSYADTPPHEAMHKLFEDALNYGSPREQAFTQRMLNEMGLRVEDVGGRKRIVGSMEEFVGPLPENTPRGEEDLTQTLGEDVVRRAVNPAQNDTIRQAMADFADYYLKNRVTPESARRMLSGRLMYGRGTAPSVSKAAGVEAGRELAQQQQEAQARSAEAEQLATERARQAELDRVEAETLRAKNDERAARIEALRAQVDQPRPRTFERTEGAPAEEGAVVPEGEMGYDPFKRSTPVETVNEPTPSPSLEQFLASPRSAEMADQPQLPRLVGSARRGLERAQSKVVAKAKRDISKVNPADLSEVARPVSRTYEGESIPANVRRGRTVRQNLEESPEDLELRRIEDRLSGRDRSKYQPLRDGEPTPGTFQSIQRYGLREDTRRLINAVRTGAKPVTYLTSSDREFLNLPLDIPGLVRISGGGRNIYTRPGNEDYARRVLAHMNREDLTFEDMRTTGELLGYKPAEIDEFMERAARTKYQPLREGERNVAYHAGDLKYGADTAIGRMGGRSTGHYGTGTYFVGSKDKITGRTDRPVQEVDLSGYNLAKPRHDLAADKLHEGLRSVNNLVDRQDNLNSLTDSYEIEALTKRMREQAEKAARDISYAIEKPVTADDVLEIAKSSVEDYVKHFPRSTYAESASTRLMRKLGFEGVDVRGLKNSDNTSRGTVVYGPEFAPKSKYQRFGPEEASLREAQVNSPEFKNWFGDSVVKDETGKPKMVYHGTSKDKDFTKFAQNKRGLWFTDNPESASSYAKQNDSRNYSYEGGKIREVNTSDRVYPVYLSIKKPLKVEGEILNKWRMSTNYRKANAELVEYAQRNGYDGLDFGSGNYVAFEPTQIKSAIGNRGTFDPSKPDIRYQRFGPGLPTSSLPDADRKGFSPFESASQKAERSSNPVVRTVGRALSELFPAQRAMQGKYRALPEAFSGLNEKDADLLYEIMIEEDRTGTSLGGTVPARLRPNYRRMRDTLVQMRKDQIAAKHYRESGVVPQSDPTYFPNVVDPSIRKTMANEPDTARYKQLKQEFLDFNKDYQMRRKGKTAAEAAKIADEYFNRFVGTLSKQPVEGAFDFGAVSLPAGSKLPDNWLHADPAAAMRQYVRDWSRSRTFHDNVMTNEDVMAGLGSETYRLNGKTVPVSKRVTPVIKNEDIRFLLNEAVGVNAGSTDKVTGAIGRAASTMWLANPITRSVDIATPVFKAAGMIPPSKIPGMIANLRSLGRSIEHAHDTGWVKEDGNTIVGEVLGAGEQFTNAVDKFSRGLSKYTGSEWLENFGRGLSQNLGEYVARTHMALAKSGDKRATEFLQRVAKNWDTLSEAELGTRIGQLFQGRYDATNLPRWLADSPAAPFFSLARWNIEQWNNFREFAIEPAKKGDVAPLISMLVAGLAGGVGVKEIREALGGRKSKVATISEILEAPEGSAKYIEGVRYLGNLAQLTGTMGIVSEMGNWALDIASKDKPQGLSMPALEVTSDIIPRLVAAAVAIADGQDPLTVLMAVGRDIGNEHVSAYRFLETNAGRLGLSEMAAEDLADANARRDLRVGKRLRGETVRPAVGLPIDYSRAEERRVEKTRGRDEMVERAKELRTDILSEPDRDRRAERLRSAASSRPSYLPSPTSDPKGFREQLDFVSRTQGPEAARRLRERYLRDKRLADTRRLIFK